MRDGSLSASLSADPFAARPDWRDGKRYLWLLGTVVPLFLFAGWGLVNLTGLGLFWWIGPIVIYVMIPLLDVLIGDDPSNAPEDVVAWLEQDRYYRWVTYLFLPCQFAALVTGCWLIHLAAATVSPVLIRSTIRSSTGSNAPPGGGGSAGVGCRTGGAPGVPSAGEDCGVSRSSR